LARNFCPGESPGGVSPAVLISMRVFERMLNNVGSFVVMIAVLIYRVIMKIRWTGVSL
jgi:hypothetical protein